MKIKIYNETWTITEVTQEEFQKIAPTTDECTHYGMCRDSDSVIMLLKTLGIQRKRSVLIHEVTHAIFTSNMLLNVDLSEEFVANYLSAHIDEINKVVKEYFKPKPKRKVSLPSLIQRPGEIVEV